MTDDAPEPRTLTQGAVLRSTAPSSVTPVVPADIARGRRYSGYILMFSAVFLALVFVAHSLSAIDEFKPSAVVDPQGKLVESTIDYIRLAVRAGVSVAFLFFLFGLLQVGERMIVPAEWVKSTADLRLLLGVKSPAAVVGKELRGVVEAAASLLTASRGNPKS